MVCWQLAANEGGFQSIALNPALSGAEIQRIVDHSDANALVLHRDFADRVDQMSGTGSIKLRVSVGGDIEGFVSEESLVEGQPTTEPPDRRLGIPIVYSSGTTGQPKAVVRPDLPIIDPSVAADFSKSFGHAFQFQPLTGVHLVSAGMHHGGCQSFYLGALNVGQALVILGKFDPEKTLAAIERHRVTTAYMVPTQFVRFLRLPQEVKDKYDVSSLEVVVHSAAPCPLEVKKQMMDWWGPVIWETYGGMEGAATIAKPYRWIEKPVNGQLPWWPVHQRGQDPRRGGERAPTRRGRRRVSRAGAREHRSPYGSDDPELDGSRSARERPSPSAEHRPHGRGRLSLHPRFPGPRT